jgi:hypothetical protein
MIDLPDSEKIYNGRPRIIPFSMETKLGEGSV